MFYECLENYVNNIVVKSQEVGHIDDRSKIFLMCGKYNLRMNLFKCASGALSNQFLGFTIHRKESISIQLKVKTIQYIKRPCSDTNCRIVQQHKGGILVGREGGSGGELYFKNSFS